MWKKLDERAQYVRMLCIGQCLHRGGDKKANNRCTSIKCTHMRWRFLALRAHLSPLIIAVSSLCFFPSHLFVQLESLPS